MESAAIQMNGHPRRRNAGDPFVYPGGFELGARLVEVSYGLACEMVRAILDEVGAATVRQVYYNGSRRGWWEKDAAKLGPDGKPVSKAKPKSYKRVSKWLTRMRADGVVEYDEILEYGRQLAEPLTFGTAEDYAEYTASAFFLDQWLYQPRYVEVWVEGESIAPIADRALKGLRVPLMMNKGNSSTTAIREAAERLEERVARHADTHGLDTGDLPCGLVHVLYCGDHDAAGWNMDGNIVQRLKDHGSFDLAFLIVLGVIEFKRIALTLDHVIDHDIEPDTKRATGDIAKAYREHFADHRLVRGDLQWSFEALPVPVALKAIRDEVEALMDKSRWKRGKAFERAVRAKLREGGAIVG
jgi:hypothetical protein